MSDIERFKKDKLSQMESRCREQGLPVTVQRRVIMDVLAGRCDHPTADQVFEEVRQRIVGVSRTTVYRVLETLVGNGLAQKICNQQAKARFDAQTRRHHHVECLRCGAVADVHDATLDLIAIPEGERSGFHITDYSISFKGTCPDCSSLNPQT